MIAGPRGIGKKMLVHSICTETGANLFDITPANVAGKFAGKKGLDMLLHMVFKVRTNVHVYVFADYLICYVHTVHTCIYHMYTIYCENVLCYRSHIVKLNNIYTHVHMATNHKPQGFCG